jgi:hypothetical protein
VKTGKEPLHTLHKIGALGDLEALYIKRCFMVNKLIIQEEEIECGDALIGSGTIA